MNILIKYVLPLIATVLFIYAIYHVTSSESEQPKTPAPIPPPQSPYENTIAGVGIVETVLENIEITAFEPGVIEEVFVQEGTEVHRGEKLVRFNHQPLLAELQRRKAAIDLANAELDRLKAEPRAEKVPITKAQENSAKQTLIQAQDEYQRIQRLAEKGVLSEEELVRSKTQKQIAQAELEQITARLDLLLAGAWEKQIAVAYAQLQVRKGELAEVRARIKWQSLTAPVDGAILKVNKSVGEYVRPDTEPIIVMGDTNSLCVRVDIDEFDLPRFRINQPATGVVRGYPRSAFSLEFVRTEPYVVPKTSLTGENTERVDTRVLQVIYRITQPEDNASVYPGQQIDVFIKAVESLPTEL